MCWQMLCHGWANVSISCKFLNHYRRNINLRFIFNSLVFTKAFCSILDQSEKRTRLVNTINLFVVLFLVEMVLEVVQVEGFQGS